jgi:hypothetical protein
MREVGRTSEMAVARKIFGDLAASEVNEDLAACLR